MKTSDSLTVGSVYTRKELKAKFKITDATINTGIFKPSGHDSVWLFVTEEKQSDRTQYNDLLEGDVLEWDSQPGGRKDDLIIEHKDKGLELLLFYRKKKYEFEGAGFRFEGPFDYLEHSGEGPAHFRLLRATAVGHGDNLQASAVAAALEAAESALAARTGQGFSSSPERRKAVELHAMSVATDYFENRGFEIEDTSANKPYDLVAKKGADKLYVEVKGTTAGGEQVFLTKNEVAHAQAHPNECVLFIVHGIEVAGSQNSPTAKGGTSIVVRPWVPANEDLLALSFQYTVPSKK
jgi:hypothetical protein